MNEEKVIKQQKFSKEAFLNAAKNTQERLVIQIVLQDGTSYTKAEAEKLVNNWKKKEVK
ncbi:hypothetical protein P9274_20210 [Schinkia azotoformans]|uniref:hypothetical protein n=1 Tax=Schinkia azotoformans TaxID=1454 RepID=UPI002E23C15B|nr:hypothetical protein [Schinkia azotoformans]